MPENPSDLVRLSSFTVLHVCGRVFLVFLRRLLRPTILPCKVHTVDVATEGRSPAAATDNEQKSRSASTWVSMPEGGGGSFSGGRGETALATNSGSSIAFWLAASCSWTAWVGRQHG
jgi:hypothetical protein